MRRGEVWWASLREPIGSEPGYRRPLLILQSDDFNDSPIRTTICAVVTSNLRLADAPGNVRVRRRAVGLPRDSVVNVSQLITVDKVALTSRLGRLPRRRYEMSMPASGSYYRCNERAPLVTLANALPFLATETFMPRAPAAPGQKAGLVPGRSG